MSPDPEKAIRVLFVEDAFDQALLVKAFLQSLEPCQVVHAQDGEHAAQMVRDQEWDLLITDLNLPGLDGFELCRIARSVKPSLPVLAVTGYTGAHYQEQAFRSGANDLLTKPIDRDEFLAKVRELLGMEEEKGAPAVLAVGGLVGDAEMGCGASLALHRAAGSEITIVALCRDETDLTDAGLHAARLAADSLGARVILDQEAMDDTQRRVELLNRLVRELNPQVMYIPASDEMHPCRREAMRIAKAVGASVPVLLGYQTATTGYEFRPDRFQDMGDSLMPKLEALTAYQHLGLSRPDLAPRLAHAYARYWGRMDRFNEVEAFEVLRD